METRQYNVGLIKLLWVLQNMLMLRLTIIKKYLIYVYVATIFNNKYLILFSYSFPDPNV